MSNKENEKIANLEKEVQKVIEQRDGLLKRVAELESAKPASKSRQQALAGLEMLKQGPVSQAQFKKLNEKYPSDVAYYIRSLLRLDVKTVRLGEGRGTCYMLAEHYAKYQENLKAEKEAAEKAKAQVAADAGSKSAQAVAKVIAGAGIVQPAA